MTCIVYCNDTARSPWNSAAVGTLSFETPNFLLMILKKGFDSLRANGTVRDIDFAQFISQVCGASKLHGSYYGVELFEW